MDIQNSWFWNLKIVLTVFSSELSVEANSTQWSMSWSIRKKLQTCGFISKFSMIVGKPFMYLVKISKIPPSFNNKSRFCYCIPPFMCIFSLSLWNHTVENMYKRTVFINITDIYLLWIKKSLASVASLRTNMGSPSILGV